MAMFADVNLSTEAVGVIGVLVMALAGTITLLFKLLIKVKDDQLKEMESQRNSYRQISEEAIANLEKAAQRYATLVGKVHVKRVDPVMPEHDSPVTQKQQDVADLQTHRARLVAATLQLDLPARGAVEVLAPPTKEDSFSLVVSGS